jgi:hypothetical protein
VARSSVSAVANALRNVDPLDDRTPDGADALVSWWVVDREASGALERASTSLVPRRLAERWGFRAVRYAP